MKPIMQCLSIALVLVASCATKGPMMTQNSWAYERIEFSELRSFNTDEVDQSLIEALKDNYRSFPYMPGYAEIELDKVLVSPLTGHRYFMFQILHVSDTQAVFVVDENNDIVDYFLYSSWQ